MFIPTNGQLLFILYKQNPTFYLILFVHSCPHIRPRAAMLCHRPLISLFHLSPWSQHSKPISHSLSSPSFTPSPFIASVRAPVRTELLFFMSSPRKLSRCGQWMTGLTTKICNRMGKGKLKKRRERMQIKLQSNKSYWLWFRWQWDQTKIDTGRAQMGLLQSSLFRGLVCLLLQGRF